MQLECVDTTLKGLLVFFRSPCPVLYMLASPVPSETCSRSDSFKAMRPSL